MTLIEAIRIARNKNLPWVLVDERKNIYTYSKTPIEVPPNLYGCCDGVDFIGTCHTPLGGMYMTWLFEVSKIKCL